MARPILNRRQLLSAILVTGAAGGVGLATAGPAFAGPPSGWRLLDKGLAESPVTTDGVINHQSLIGVWTNGSDFFNTRIYRGVRLHNTSSRTRTVRYQHLRTTWISLIDNSTRVPDEIRSWDLGPGERKVVWFGGWSIWSYATSFTSYGRTQYGGRAWGPESRVSWPN